MLARTFTILAAFLLVAAIAAAALAPPGITLGRGLSMMNGYIEPWIRVHSPSWLQSWVEVPIMARPLWLPVAALGVICAGIAASATLGTGSPSPRRRS
ncbi:MAG: hypothetical protein ACRYHQ_19280 [Janthinobacterium lividum]